MCEDMGNTYPVPTDEEPHALENPNRERTRTELVTLTRKPEANISELARRFGLSRKTIYRWLYRDSIPLTGEQQQEVNLHGSGRLRDLRHKRLQPGQIPTRACDRAAFPANLTTISSCPYFSF